MARIARIALEGVPYHITQRGNGRQQVFFDDIDYRVYLDWLAQHSVDAGLRVWAYCLMPNHVHVVAVPERPESMASALARTHSGFARYFNLKRRSCGHVWQARFFSCPLEASHLWRAVAYVERNPVRAGIVEHADCYRWSSAAVRLGSGGDEFLDLKAWEAEYTASQWWSVLCTGVDEEAFGRRLQEASRRGRPLGESGFTDELEVRLGRALRPLLPGRPKKSESESSAIGV
jgi:putative transposase